MSCIEADSKIIGLYEKLFAKNVKKKDFKKIAQYNFNN